MRLTRTHRQRARPRLEAQSRVILEAIAQAGGQPVNTTEINQHLIAEGIHLPTSSLYRALRALSEEGRLVAAWRSEKTGHASAAYRLAEAAAAPRMRIVCRRCGHEILVQPDSDLALALAQVCRQEGLAFDEGTAEVLIGCRGCGRGG